MSKPFFSIIIPALNEEKYLPHLLQDLSNQSFQDFEVIVVDGKSDDQTAKKARTFTTKLPSLSILTSDKRHVCTQRNLGAKSAKAEILIFSDADNRLPPYFLQGIKYRWESEKVAILSPLINATDNTSQNNTIATAMNLFLELEMSIKPHTLLEACVITSHDCFNQVGGFDDNIHFAEGNVFLDQAIKLGYKATIIKDPNYQFSFRRLKKFGTAKTISNTVRLQLMDLIGIDQSKINLKKLYPMLGGKAYNTSYKLQKNKITKFIKNLKKIIKDF